MATDSSCAGALRFGPKNENNPKVIDLLLKLFKSQTCVVAAKSKGI